MIEWERFLASMLILFPIAYVAFGICALLEGPWRRLAEWLDARLFGVRW